MDFKKFYNEIEVDTKYHWPTRSIQPGSLAYSSPIYIFQIWIMFVCFVFFSQKGNVDYENTKDVLNA